MSDRKVAGVLKGVVKPLSALRAAAISLQILSNYAAISSSVRLNKVRDMPKDEVWM